MQQGSELYSNLHRNLILELKLGPQATMLNKTELKLGLNM